MNVQKAVVSENNMKRLVLINFCNGLYGGIESFLLNAFYCLDKKEYDVTFLTCGRSTYDMYREDIILKGGHVEEIPILASGFTRKVALFYKLRKYFRKSKPDIVHINSGTLSLHLLASEAAKSENVPRIILHSHNFYPNRRGAKEKVKGIIKYYLTRNVSSFLACSAGAAKWIFPDKLVEQNKVVIIPNGVDTKRFLYNEENRRRFREEFHLDGELLIGNIGRFERQKNHGFMIKIMDKIIETKTNVKLLLVGEGELKSEIQQLVEEHNLQKNVIFVGERKDMDVFLSAIDVFIMPSLYEGLGIAAVEAQAAGTKVLLSDTIPKETNITGSAIYLPIAQPGDEKKWVEEICKVKANVDRNSENKKVYIAGYDIHTCYEKLIEIYGEEPLNAYNK